MGGCGSKKKQRRSVPDGLVSKTPWADGHFDGVFLGGQPSGSGTLRRKDGSTLVGEWLKGVPHGQCAAREANGDSYVGAWSKGLCDGEGVWTSAKGDSYEGTWKEGRAHGLGQWTWSNGEKYAGECAFGTKHGVGTHTYANGSTWKGTWDMDRKKTEQGVSAPRRVSPAHGRAREASHTDKLRNAMTIAHTGSDRYAEKEAAAKLSAAAAEAAAAAELEAKQKSAPKSRKSLRWPSVKRLLGGPTSPKAGRPKSRSSFAPSGSGRARPKSSKSRPKSRPESRSKSSEMVSRGSRAGTLPKLSEEIVAHQPSLVVCPPRPLLAEQPAPEPPRSQPDHTRNCSGLEGIIQVELEAEAEAEAVCDRILRTPSQADLRERLVAFYTAHNTGKMGTVDATLARYKGREDALFRKLEKKYGVGQFAPADAAQLAAVRRMSEGEGGGGGGGAEAAYADRLRAFYEEHNPAKVGTVDTILGKYIGRQV